MTDSTFSLPLELGPGARLTLALLAAVLGLGWFLALPAADAIQHRDRHTLRLAAVPAPPLHRPRHQPRLESLRPAPEEAAALCPAQARPAMQNPPARNAPVLRIAPLLPALSALTLPVRTLQIGLGDVSVDFLSVAASSVEDSSPAPAAPVFTVSELDAPPRLLARVTPLYPLMAKQRRIEGLVDIAFYIEPDGSVSEIAVVGGEPSGLFDAAAGDAVRRWRFSAPKKDGRAVRMSARQRIEFRLETP